MADRTAQRLGYELRDVNARAVAIFALGLVVCAIVIHLSLVALFALFHRQHPSPNPPSREVVRPRILAPEPRLQTNPAADIDAFRATEEKLLNSYGWVDKQHTVARIPIERALELIVQRGLPARGVGTQDSSGKTPQQMRQEKGAPIKP